MNKKIESCHNLLNEIYANCENLYSKIKNKYKNAKIESYNGHYIKINDKYEYQKYYMPIISIGGIGDICFNFDGVSLEFFVEKKELLNNCDFDSLLKYNVEIYDANDSTIDIYQKDMTLDLFINKLEQWQPSLIGITINCQDKNDKEIVNIFESIIIILGVDK